MTRTGQCPCGNRVEIPEGTSSLKCPSCHRNLTLRSDSTTQHWPAESIRQSHTPEAKPPEDRLERVTCPCGYTLSVPSGDAQAECPQCGVVFRRKASTAGLPHAALGAADLEDDSPRHLSANAATTPIDSVPLSTRDPLTAPTVAGKTKRPAARNRALLIFGVFGLVSVSILVVAATWVAYRASTNDLEPSQDLSAAGSVGSEVSAANPNGTEATSHETPEGETLPVGEYPKGARLSQTTEVIERQFADTIPVTLERLFLALPPNDNAAPHYLSALAQIEPELVAGLPDLTESQRLLIKDDAQRARDQIHAAWHSPGEPRPDRLPAPTPSDLEKFDSLMEQLRLAQQRPGFSLYYLPDFEDLFWNPSQLSHRSYHKALLTCFRLVDLRFEVLSPNWTVAKSIEEFDTLFRLLGHVETGDSIDAWYAATMRSMAYQTMLPAILSHPELDAASARRLFTILKRHPPREVEHCREMGCLRSRLSFAKFLGQVVDQPTGAGLIDQGWSRLLGKNSTTRPGVERSILVAALDDFDEVSMERCLARWDEYAEQWFDEEGNESENLRQRSEQRRGRLLPLAGVDFGAIASGQPMTAEMAGHWLTATYWLNQTQLESDFVYLAAWDRVALIQVGLQCWQLEHPATPLSTDFSNLFDSRSQWTDPYTGDVLQLAERDGTLIVYSVGPNLNDERAVRLAIDAADANGGDVFVPNLR